jgi:transposase InsO family protein
LKPFLEVFKKAKIKPHRTAIRSPNTVAFDERFVQTIKQECLDHFVVFGHKHMDFLCQEFKDHYCLERPHQGLERAWKGLGKRVDSEAADEESEEVLDMKICPGAFRSFNKIRSLPVI